MDSLYDLYKKHSLDEPSIEEKDHSYEPTTNSEEDLEEAQQHEMLLESISLTPMTHAAQAVKTKNASIDTENSPQ